MENIAHAIELEILFSEDLRGARGTSSLRMTWLARITGRSLDHLRYLTHRQGEEKIKRGEQL